MKTKRQNGVAANIVPGTVHPQQALQGIRNIMAGVVMIHHNDGTKGGLTLGDRNLLEQWFEIIKAALPKEANVN